MSVPERKALHPIVYIFRGGATIGLVMILLGFRALQIGEHTDFLIGGAAVLFASSLGIFVLRRKS